MKDRQAMSDVDEIIDHYTNSTWSNGKTWRDVDLGMEFSTAQLRALIDEIERLRRQREWLLDRVQTLSEENTRLHIRLAETSVPVRSPEAIPPRKDPTT